MVRSEKIFSPQAYIELVTGNYYFFRGDDDIAEVEKILKLNGLCLWNYPLTEIDHIVENDLDVILVECLVWDERNSYFAKVCRWFEVPSDCEISED